MSALASAFRRPSHSASPDKTQQQASRSRRMPSLFNTIRLSIYATVLVLTVICLGMAGHFQSVLAASDLTRFVPFAIFVCVASLFIFTILILFSVFLRERNPISTRIELASLGLAGVFWLVLGVYLTTSEAQDADVECFESADSQVVLDEQAASFHTDQFQSMYRVLMAFALMNAALIIAACLILLFLAFRRHKQGDVHMWHGPRYKAAAFGASEKPQQRKKSSLLPTHAVAAGAAAIGGAAAAVTRSKSTTRTPPTARRDPKRQNSSRSATQPTRQNSSRSQTAAAIQPTRQDSGRSEPRRQNSGREPHRSNSGRDPQRSNSARDPHRSNSGRDAQRQNSTGRRQQSSTTNPYMASYYNAPLPNVPRQARYAPTTSSTSTDDYDAGHMVNPARQNSQRR
ncbi:hypothetical protein FA13DRAFT_1728700 [Coprinellus micaceus]|uniref:MARVEL domain-containing protein n=1 Tax=Coprinellus micaceus TaxID=71717 RepID=A0A4Y7TPH2_COPMI|nr:hypothetical protein FA13DRAFT_1728700 [Coprinellus micaceus]